MSLFHLLKYPIPDLLTKEYLDDLPPNLKEQYLKNVFDAAPAWNSSALSITDFMKKSLEEALIEYED
jgi:hypothetical protein